MGIGKHDHSLFLILCYVIPTGGAANISRPFFLRANNAAHFSLLRVRICTTKLCQNPGKSGKHLQVHVRATKVCRVRMKQLTMAVHLGMYVKRERPNSWLFSLMPKRSSNPFTILSVKKDTLSLVVATGVVLSDALMGGRSNMSWVSMIYYYPITCLGDRGPNSQDHLLRSGSRPDLRKHALCRRRRQVPVCGQVCRHV